MRKKCLFACCTLLVSTLLFGAVHSFQVAAKATQNRPVSRLVMFESQAKRVFDKVLFVRKKQKRIITAAGEMLPQAEFTRRVNALAGSAKADVYVLDTKTGRKLTYYNGGTDFWLASSIKASILTALVKEEGPLSGGLDQEAQAMITYSDNDAAIDLFNAAGGFTALEALWANLGMTSTFPNNNGFGLSTSTAGDQIKLLQGIKTLPTDEHNYILDLMKGITASQRFGIGVMKDPAFKNGWLNADNGSWYVNSIGFSDKERYLVAILTQNNADQISGEKLVSRIAGSIIKK
ncbi:MAG: serine hydrolase [Oenococcus sp.]|uniref:serine hydrolase n=1 Tax=Oenococcus sp. TaxID=1979414 RepID=UPI0039EBBCE9